MLKELNAKILIRIFTEVVQESCKTYIFTAIFQLCTTFFLYTLWNTPPFLTPYSLLERHADRMVTYERDDVIFQVFQKELVSVISVLRAQEIKGCNYLSHTSLRNICISFPTNDYFFIRTSYCKLTKTDISAIQSNRSLTTALYPGNCGILRIFLCTEAVE